MAVVDLNELVDPYGEDMLKMDGYDACVVGVVLRCGQNPILCYDYELVIKDLMSTPMSREEAVEFFEFNQLGAWMGDKTPCFLQRKP